MNFSYKPISVNIFHRVYDHSTDCKNTTLILYSNFFAIKILFIGITQETNLMKQV